MKKIVVDTNIIVSAALKAESLPALLISLVVEDRVKLFISAVMFKEYGQVLLRPKFGFNIKDVKEYLAVIKNKAVIVEPLKRVRRIKTDEQDNKILECALETQADFIITGDKKHFSFKNFRGIRIITPSEFINLMDFA